MTTSITTTSQSLLRLHKPSRTLLTSTPFTRTQVRHASLLKRPHRPYTFTQLISLSDGSTYTVRTTSPAPVHRSTLDSRNHAIWQPSADALRNVEKDEAGRLRAFRERFGRGWDAEGDEEVVDGGSEGRKKEERVVRKEAKEDGEGSESGGDSLFDLISGAASGGKK